MTDPMHPLNCACFNLRRAARRVTQAYDRALRAAGIQAPQFTILAVLGGEDDGLTVSDLAERLGMDRTTLTRNLAVVEKHGWVEAVPGEDRRERLTCLTDAGRARFAQALPRWQEAQAAAIDALGDSGMEDLLKLTRRLADG